MVLISLHSENQLEKKNPIREETGKKRSQCKSGLVARPERRVLVVTLGAVTKCSHLCPMDLSLLIFFIVLLLPPGSLSEKQLNEFSVPRASVLLQVLLGNAMNGWWMVAVLCYGPPAPRHSPHVCVKKWEGQSSIAGSCQWKLRLGETTAYEVGLREVNVFAFILHLFAIWTWVLS